MADCPFVIMQQNNVLSWIVSLCGGPYLVTELRATCRNGAKLVPKPSRVCKNELLCIAAKDGNPALCAYAIAHGATATSAAAFIAARFNHAGLCKSLTLQTPYKNMAACGALMGGHLDLFLHLPKAYAAYSRTSCYGYPQHYFDDELYAVRWAIASGDIATCKSVFGMFNIKGYIDYHALLPGIIRDCVSTVKLAVQTYGIWADAARQCADVSRSAAMRDYFATVNPIYLGNNCFEHGVRFGCTDVLHEIIKDVDYDNCMDLSITFQSYGGIYCPDAATADIVVDFLEFLGDYREKSFMALAFAELFPNPHLYMSDEPVRCIGNAIAGNTHDFDKLGVIRELAARLKKKKPSDRSLQVLAHNAFKAGHVDVGVYALGMLSVQKKKGKFSPSISQGLKKCACMLARPMDRMEDFGEGDTLAMTFACRDDVSWFADEDRCWMARRDKLLQLLKNNV